MKIEENQAVSVATENEPDRTAVQPLSVNKRGLIRIGASPTFIDYLVKLWDYRHFSIFDAKARIRSGSRRDKLGSAWLFMNPLLNGITYYFVFGILLNTSAGIENYVGFLLIGIFLFQYSSRAITNGARCIESNRGMVQAFKFPRATLAIAVNLRESLANIPPMLAMLLLVVLVPPGEAISWRWLLVLPALCLLGIFNLGVGLLLARVISRVRDVSHLIPFVLRAWMYGSAVFFSYERFVEDPLMLDLLRINPLFNAIDIIRDSVLYHTTPSWQSWAYLIVVSLSTLAVGIIFFWRGEESYGRQQ